MGSTKAVEFTLLFVMVTCLPFLLNASSSGPPKVLHRGSSLSVDRRSIDVLVSENGTFRFYQVGENAFSFAIWFNETLSQQATVVWMANRDWSVNGRASRLFFRKGGDLALLDAEGSVVWTTNVDGVDAGAVPGVGVVVELLETGNLSLLDGERTVVWQSFDHPTDTLLPGQPLTSSMRLVSKAAESNYSSGYYAAHFSDDNVLSFFYNRPTISSIYWPNPDNTVFENGRTRYNSSRYGILDDMGQFTSSDRLQFSALDFGTGVKRVLKMDFDGILRLYTLNPTTREWEVSWMPKLERCMVHGLCGENGICVYKPTPTCTCPPGFLMKDRFDWTQGCKPQFDIVCDETEVKFRKLPHTDFYGYDLRYQTNVSFEACQNNCRSDCRCRGYGYRLDGEGHCYPKSILRSGQSNPLFVGDMYIKIPIEMNFSVGIVDKYNLTCPKESSSKKLDRVCHDCYLIGFVIAVGVAEIICVAFGWAYLHKMTIHIRNVNQGYVVVTRGFRRFTFQELKKATSNFSDEIGRGGSGVIYKGVLKDKRVVAVKKLEGLSHGSDVQFWSEISTIGRINHMNLVAMFGFCAEKQKRLLVYEYLENGSLEKNLFSNGTMLTWEKRFDIALGTAKALAYLHEECLEWVLHCDVKPQNVLLDGDFRPKVADFGLSKLFDRGGNNISEFSRVRGTRGYMAPQWIVNLPITSKVDVYSYGILVLELVTGRSSTGFQQMGENGEVGYKQLIPWVREMVRTNQKWVEEVADPQLSGMYDN